MRYCETCRAAFQNLRMCPKDRTQTRAGIPDPLIGQVLGDRYRILEPIAAGGMGQVYRAAHTRIASLFAVKVLYGDLAYDANMRARFQREAEAASCLQSRHIVRVIDFSESTEGLLYIAMEHLAGRPLSAIIADDLTLPPARATSVALQIARGLADAHERGIVHRDLKPGNVMLIREDDEPDVVRLLDFGIARLAAAAALTQAGAVLGTPEYMAPEQFRGSATIDGRADLYALGIMLFEMLTGDIPFYDEDLVKFAHLHFYEVPPPPSAVTQGRDPIPPELDAIVMRLLEKKPESRFASARELIAALKAVPLQRAIESARSISPASLVPEPICGSAAAERIHGVIGVGSPVYNAGDHAGCAALYRQAATTLLATSEATAGALRDGTRIAASARLELALHRADLSRDPTRAAWELRWAFDDLLQVLRTGGASSLAVELAAAATIAAPRYAAGELDLVAAYFVAFASHLAARNRDAGGDPSVAAALDGALRSCEGAARGTVLENVGHALDQLRASAGPAAAPRVTRGRCAAEQQQVLRINAALTVGVPAYNRGDHDACYRAYREAAHEILEGVGPRTRRSGVPCPSCADLSTLLTTALERATPLGASQAAWTLRHAFDEILATAGQV